MNNQKCNIRSEIIRVNPLYIIINEVDGSIAEKNGNEYLTFGSIDKNKNVLEKYTKLWNETEYHIKRINGSKSGEYEKDFMKIKFNSDDNLPLNKALKLHNLTIMVRSVFEEDDKYYPKVFLDECLYKLHTSKEYDKMHQKNVSYVIIGVI